jgi:hypothetical protein
MGLLSTTRRLVVCSVLGIVILTTASAADNAASRLRNARSLRCTFSSSVDTWVRTGHRVIEQTQDKGTAVYDNIDIARGTARIVANAGAADIVVWLDSIWGSLWMLERTPSGNMVVTTVFPMYAEGTDEFVVLEARHSITGQIVLGQDSYGTCKTWE